MVLDVRDCSVFDSSLLRMCYQSGGQELGPVLSYCASPCALHAILMYSTQSTAIGLTQQVLAGWHSLVGTSWLLKLQQTVT